MFILLVLLALTCLWLLPGLWALGCRARDRRGQAVAAVSPSERALAEERSRALLRDMLDEREYQQLMQHGYVDIASPSHEKRTYRIPRNAGRVCVYESGRALVELCVQPVTPLPANDVVVMHKLLIESDEQGYLACANEIPLVLPPRFYTQQNWTFMTL